MANQIGSICETLSHVKKCPGCGGNILGSCCAFCGREVTGSQELIAQLNTALTGQVSQEDFPALVNIKDLDIPSVTEYIAANTESFRQHMISGLSNANYEDIIRFLGAENHREVIPNVDSIFPYIARDYFDGKLADLDNDTYLQFIKAYADRIVQNSDMLNSNGKYPTIRFVSSSEMPRDSIHGLCQASNGGSEILLNRDTFLQYREQNPYLNLESVYHELQHAIQNNSFANPDRFDLTGFLIAQDGAIRSENPTYYDENYEILPIEADANFAAYQALHRDLMCCGRELPGVDDELRYYAALRVNPNRSFNGVSTSTDELFEQININPFALKQYPVLNLVYEYVNGKVVKKDKERLMEALQSETNPNIAEIYRHALGLEIVKDEAQPDMQYYTQVDNQKPINQSDQQSITSAGVFAQQATASAGVFAQQATASANAYAQQAETNVNAYAQQAETNVNAYAQQAATNVNAYVQQAATNVNAYAQQAATNVNVYAQQAAMNVNTFMQNNQISKMQICSENNEIQGKSR